MEKNIKVPVKNEDLTDLKIGDVIIEADGKKINKRYLLYTADYFRRRVYFSCGGGTHQLL